MRVAAFDHVSGVVRWRAKSKRRCRRRRKHMKRRDYLPMRPGGLLAALKRLCSSVTIPALLLRLGNATIFSIANFSIDILF
jgi:hypothetical protein